MVSKTYLWRCLDVAAVVGGFYFAYAIRLILVPSKIQPETFYYPLVWYGALVFIVANGLYRLYIAERNLFSLSYLVDFLRAVTLWIFLLVAFSFFTKAGFSRLLVLFFSSVTILFALLWRVVASRTQRNERTFSLGDRELATAMQHIIDASLISVNSLAMLEGLRSRWEPGVLYCILKRVFDLLGASIGLVLTVPFYPLIVWCIRHETDGRGIIIQQRVGRNGMPFRLYKFRTMHQEVPLYAPAPRRDTDPRITNVGAILRKYSIDELPQLWNVLKGDMSIVGPRPEMSFIVERYEPWQRIRLEVKPGITGLWQILGRKDLPLAEHLEYDLYYVLHQSFLLDLAILLKTVPHLLLPRGAY